MVGAEVNDIYLMSGENAVQYAASDAQRGPWHTFPYSVKVIFACLRLTTGHRNNARPGSSGTFP